MTEDNAPKHALVRYARRGGRARERLARAERRRWVAERNLAGLTQAEIAAELGLSAATVSSDIAAVREEWRRDARGDLGEALARELAALQRDERDVRERLDALEEDAHCDRVRYYLLVLRFMERRARLLGLDAAQRIETSASGNTGKLTVEYVNDSQRTRRQRTEIIAGDPETQRLAQELAARLYGPEGVRAADPAAEVRRIIADPEKTQQLLDVVQGDPGLRREPRSPVPFHGPRPTGVHPPSGR